MPSSIRSCAAVFAHAHRPVRAVFEYASVGIGCLIEYDVIRQIRPPPAARMCGTAACTSRIEVSRFALTAASIASSSTSSARTGGGPPALATRMSSPPNRSTVAATRRAGASGSVTSAGIARTSPGSSAAVAASALGLPGADGHARTLPRQRERGPAPESLGRGRDQRDLPRHPQIHRGDATAARAPSRPPAYPGRDAPPSAPSPESLALAAVAALVVTLFSAADGREPGVGAAGRCGRTRTSLRSRAWACGSTSTTTPRGPTPPPPSPTWPRTASTRCTWRPRTSTGRSRSWTSRAWRRSSTRRTSTGSTSSRGTCPGFVDVGLDAKRSKAAIRFRTDAGNGFDGFALDIEAPDVADAGVRTARLLELSDGCGRSPARTTRSAASSRRRAGSSCTRITGRGSRTRSSPRSTT